MQSLDRSDEKSPNGADSIAVIAPKIRRERDQQIVGLAISRELHNGAKRFGHMVVT
jgi:hypothetical protein